MGSHGLSSWVAEKPWLPGSPAASTSSPVRIQRHFQARPWKTISGLSPSWTCLKQLLRWHLGGILTRYSNHLSSLLLKWRTSGSTPNPSQTAELLASSLRSAHCIYISTGWAGSRRPLAPRPFQLQPGSCHLAVEVSFFFYNVYHLSEINQSELEGTNHYNFPNCQLLQCWSTAERDAECFCNVTTSFFPANVGAQPVTVELDLFL